MMKLIAPAALFALAGPVAAETPAPFDMTPETAVAAAVERPEPGARAGAPGARRHILPAARMRLEGENAARSWQVWLTEAEATEAKLQLAYRSAIFVAPETSRLRLTVNGVRLADDPIKAPEHLTELSAVLPAGLLKAGPNVIALETEQRHRTDCTVESTYELWTEFDASRSFIAYPSAAATRLKSLEDIRAVGAGPTAATRVAILAPDLAEPATEAQALKIAQALAMATAMPNTSFTISDAADDAFRAAELRVVLGDASALGVPAGGDGPFVQAGSFGSVLVVDGSASETARIAALAAPAADAPPAIPTASWRLPDAPLVTGAARFAFGDLGAPTREFSGRRATVEIPIALPADFYAEAYGEARLLLDAAYSSEVEPGSRIDVYVNGEIASTLPIVNPGGGILRHLPIDVTMRHLRPGPNVIRIEAAMKTEADAACMPGAAAEAEPRFALFDTSELIIPAFARVGRRPELAATAGRGYPFAGAEPPMELALAGDRGAALAAAATMLGKIAQAAGEPAPFRLVDRPDPAAPAAMIVGPAAAIPAETFAGIGIDPQGLLAWQPAPADGAPAEEPSLDAWRGAVNRGAWFRPFEAAARDLRDDAGSLADNIGGAAPFAPGLGSTFLLAQGLNPAGNGSVTVVTAPTPALLASGAAEMTEESRWTQVAGRATAFDTGSEVVTVAPAVGAELVMTRPLSLFNLRLIGANWMSTNAIVFAGALAFACVLLGLATTALMTKLGRRG